MIWLNYMRDLSFSRKRFKPNTFQKEKKWILVVSELDKIDIRVNPKAVYYTGWSKIEILYTELVYSSFI